MSGPDQYVTGAGNTVSGVVMEHVDDSGNAIRDTAANPHPVTDAAAEAALGTPSDVSWVGSGTATVVAALKSVASSLLSVATNTTGVATAANQSTGNSNTGAAATVLGTTADAAWSGGGSGTIGAILKAIWTKLSSVTIVPGTITITQTVVSVTSADSVVLAANSSRKYFAVINVGVGLVSLGFGSAAVSGQGWPLTAALAVGDQGGGLSSDPGSISTQAIHAISAAGSTVVVLEGV